MDRPRVKQSGKLMSTILALGFFFISAIGTAGIVQGQQAKETPFAELDRQVKSQGGWGLDNQNLAKLFNLERKRLGNRFEPALMEYLTKDLDKHYWVSSFLEAPTYLQGAVPLPHLSLLIKQQALALLGDQSDPDSLSNKMRFSVTAAVLSEQLGFHELAIAHKVRANQLLAQHPILSASIPGMVEEEHKLYDSLPPNRQTAEAKQNLLTWKANATDSTSNNNQIGSTPPKRINVSGGVLQQQAVKKVQPPYPAEARNARVEGLVKVAILVSEEGRVIEATALEGPARLQSAALEAARQWTFKPVMLSGQAVRMSGVLSFTFSLR